MSSKIGHNHPPQPSKNAACYDEVFEGLEVRDINSLFVLSNQSSVCIIASVLCVNNDSLWYYEGCKKCAKKVDPDGKIWHYNNYRMNVHSPVIRYVSVFLNHALYGILLSCL